MDVAIVSQRADAQLTLILGFFPRVESVLSIVMTLDIALLGILAINCPALKNLNGWSTVALLPALGIGVSIVHVYRGYFPRLDGGSGSLLYFRSVAASPASVFANAFIAQNAEDRLKDVLEQIWRNSHTLTAKYEALREAFQYLAWSVIPWIISLMIFVIANRNAEAMFRN